MTQKPNARSIQSPQIVMRKVADLKKNPRNARVHSAAQIKKIAASIKRFGFIGVIVVGSNDEILAGHGRLEGAESLGYADVPTIDAGHLTEQEQRAYMLADNRIAEDSDWNKDLLRVELADLRGADFDVDVTGFDAKEIGDIIMGDDPAKKRGSAKLSAEIKCPHCDKTFKMGKESAA